MSANHLTNAQWAARARQRRIQAGLCPSCGKRPPREGRKLCAECVRKQCQRVASPEAREERKRYDAERRAKFLADGLCCRCGKRPFIPGFVRCNECRKRDNLAVRRYADIEKEQRQRDGRLSYSGEENRRFRLEAIARYGGHCLLCGEIHPEFLTIDHIDGGGSRHRKSLGNRGSGGFIRWLRRHGWPDGYRTLCYNCNMGGAIKERRAKSTSATSIYRIKIKIEAMNAYGGLRCACCGFNDEPCLTIDHVNGDGAAHRKQLGAGACLYYWLRRNGWPIGFQVLCFNCNCAKRSGTICPHALIREEVNSADSHHEKPMERCVLSEPGKETCGGLRLVGG